MAPPYLITLNKIPGIDRHELQKLARKEGSGITDEALTFKKSFQTVVRPPTTNYNIHDDYIKHPPENVSLVPMESVNLAKKRAHSNLSRWR
ncbi:uncharacterized protein BJ212DRAFT_1477247 [Suillus subaureus]|uniref:Uncharacterized protein n=1 Tax=Suillus subaureus TaxID=48587 RepID=A0A9P7JHT3_9AGAM|nr:uncharacterized protein BJ212DRAFT_1477247 [Suillus subaureus]KAG1822840.1 hypothetical protein BJ212DRAFT_1477247 [Suillus subaureus]